MKNNLENKDIKTDKPLAMSYEALKADRDAQQKRADALAVENAAQGAALSLISGCYGLSPHIQSMCAVETPATSAALDAVRAQERADLISVFNQQIKNTGLDDEALVTVLECREALKHAVELREAK
ncbi:hypothetical protein JKX24_16420 [Serratia proteamaculans]|uniref:Uncharacterized protein n=1 Tax=Serratia proteamaculans TaxID=28151 RepID=A0A7U0N3J6_SERPR|nr:hypothetical protein [Serratia proteamaculans]MBO1505024.1 hypothetical protein [Serratia proteamaculans]QQX51788.1 hypothetical protein JKX24_16420 [Serratia proteamaculans]